MAMSGGPQQCHVVCRVEVYKGVLEVKLPIPQLSASLEHATRQHLASELTITHTPLHLAKDTHHYLCTMHCSLSNLSYFLPYVCYPSICHAKIKGSCMLLIPQNHAPPSCCHVNHRPRNASQTQNLSALSSSVLRPLYPYAK